MRPVEGGGSRSRVKAASGPEIVAAGAFDAAWYLRVYLDVAAGGADPRSHYEQFGRAEGRFPSADAAIDALAFDGEWYLARYPDVAAADYDALTHFLHFGRAEGRSPNGRAPLEKADITQAHLRRLDLAPPGEEVALFAADPGRLDGSLVPPLRTLSGLGINTVLVISLEGSDPADFSEVPITSIEPFVSAVFLRERIGGLHAAWSHVIRSWTDLCNRKVLYLLSPDAMTEARASRNDGLETKLQAQIVALRKAGTDLASLVQDPHGLPSCRRLDAAVLRSPSFAHFLTSIEATESDGVLERRLIGLVQAGGLSHRSIDAAARADRPLGIARLRAYAERARHLVTRAAPGASGGHAAAPRRPRSSHAESGHRPIRATFIGPWNFESGLGVASRRYLGALMQSGLSVNVQPRVGPMHIHPKRGISAEAISFVGPSDVAIIHLNPDTPHSLLSRTQEATIASARLRIGVYVWESRHLPEIFARNLARVDAVWAPTEFCAEVFRAYTSAPVHVIPYVVPIPAATSAAEQDRLRHEIGLDPDARVVLYVFDACSNLDRKNPAALVRAFAASRIAAQGWHLVLKTKNLDQAPDEARRLVEVCNTIAGVVVVDESMPQGRLDALMDIAEIYASSHRSEGFGLTIAEAMARGKIVLATDYSGSRDFVSAENGFPIRAQERTMTEDSGAYPRGTIWAEVDEAHLAACLTRAAQLDEEQRRRLSEAALRTVRTHLSSAAIARRMEHSIDILRHGAAA